MIENEKLQEMRESARFFAHKLTKKMAKDIILGNFTGKEVARLYGVPKSTFYWRIDHWLPKDDPELYQKVKERLYWDRAHNRGI